MTKRCFLVVRCHEVSGSEDPVVSYELGCVGERVHMVVDNDLSAFLPLNDQNYLTRRFPDGTPYWCSRGVYAVDFEPTGHVTKTTGKSVVKVTKITLEPPTGARKAPPALLEMLKKAKTQQQTETAESTGAGFDEEPQY